MVRVRVLLLPRHISNLGSDDFNIEPRDGKRSCSRELAHTSSPINFVPPCTRISITRRTKVRPPLLSIRAPVADPPRPACEDVVRALEECHERSLGLRIFGLCNEAKVEVNKCLRAARQAKQAQNRERAKQERAKVEARWREIDMNS